MPNKNWEILSSMQLGQYGEYYAKMEFASYGFDVYTSGVDDHGIDFIAKNSKSRYFELQVKSIRNKSYVYMKKNKWNIEDNSLYLSLLLFENGDLPQAYLIPATAWKTENRLFRYKDYEGLKSAPEYGLNISEKNMQLLCDYNLENAIKAIL